MERRLAAIFAADVAGYSRMMEVDEAGTLARLRRPTRRLGHDTVEPELTQIDRVHKGVDHPDGIVLIDPVIQA